VQSVRPPVPHPAAHAPFWHVVPRLQTVPQAPQFASSESVFVHVVPHCVSPAPHWHAPSTHAPPTAHCLPHAPQLSGSVVTSTHAAPHVVRVSPASSVVHDVVHTPLSQTCPALHVTWQLPQLSGSLATVVHVPPMHTLLPAGQAHLPAWHAKPLAQRVLQPPQLALSFWTSTHEEPHC
jgi:hypothetical protein